MTFRPADPHTMLNETRIAREKSQRSVKRPSGGVHGSAQISLSPALQSCALISDCRFYNKSEDLEAATNGGRHSNTPTKAAS